MIKTIVFVKRRDDVSFEDFCRYWVETHGPITADLPGLRSLQFNMIRPEYQRRPSFWDGVSCAIFESAAAFQAMLADEEYFVDISHRSPLIVAPLARLSNVAVTPEDVASSIKTITPIWRQAGVTRESFVNYWRRAHSKFICALPHLRAYVQNTPRMEMMRETPYCDAIAECWWESWDGVLEMVNLPEYAAVQQDEKRFADLSSSVPMVVREVQIVRNGQLVI